MLEVAVGGLGLLVGLAAVIGALSDRHARLAAWDRIAAARRRVAERLRELEQQEVALDIRASDLDLRESRLSRREGGSAGGA